MPLRLDEVKVWNMDSDVSYRLIVKDGDDIVGETNVIGPTQGGSLSLAGRNFEITRPLTLIAEKLTPYRL